MATKYPNLKVNKRKILGSKVKKLRLDGLLPVNLYGKNIKSEALQVDAKEFKGVYKEVGQTGLIEVVIGSAAGKPALIHNVQMDPVTQAVLHADLRQIDLKQKITSQVPVELSGKAPAENTGGILVQLLNEVEVEALPADLPEKIIADVSKLAEIDQSITIADLTYDKSKVTIKAEDMNELVAKIEAPEKEEVAPVAPVIEAGQEAKEGEKAEDKKEEAKLGKPEEKAKEEKKK